ncbi:MAG TPA: hypothetical protein VGR74_07095 [Actinomycetota bacterium]|nr:hypothetical protein [Actinomycetota bacterium]
MRSRTGLVGLVILVLAATAACDANKPTNTGAPASTQAGHPADHMATPTTLLPADASPEQVRGQFEQLLGHHALLAVRLMRSVVAQAPELRKAAEGSLRDNTDALTRTVSTAYGDDQGDRFGRLWRRGVADLTAYAEAVAGNDAAAKQQAREDLQADADAYGTWLSEASNGQIQAGDAQGTMRAHVETLMTQADAYAARDYDKAYLTEREAYEQLFGAGLSLAKGSVTPKAAAALDTPPEQLRSAFAMLLGEHMELIVDTQRATFAGGPEFEAAAAQVNANSAALTKGMSAIVGPGKAKEFRSAWAQHVDGLLAYSTAVAGNDQAGKEVAVEQMRGYASRLALYLSDIVKNELPLEPLTQALGEHDQHLADQVDAYAVKDYGDAVQMERVGYQQMLGVANTLVAAIQKTVKPQLPVGGSQTGLGGTAHRRR